MKTVYIRVDMNPVIATGHVMRCLPIADEIKALGGTVVFITADEYPLGLLKERGYEPIVLGSDWKDMEGELPMLLSFLKERRADNLLVDSYQVTSKYLETLNKQVRLTYLDDLDSFAYPVDRLICYANYWNTFSYAKKEEAKDYLLGLSYAPLRQVFKSCPKKRITDRIEKILLLSGGSDSYHIIENMVERFADRMDITLITVCGRFYEGYEKLKEKYKGYSNLLFYKNVSDLERYMEMADLAISAGGTTLYELCAMGTPTISYSFADNQLPNVKQFAKDGVIDYAGDVRNEDIFKNVVDLYEKYNTECALRQERSGRMQQMVDGKGALRIAKALLA